MHRNGITTPSAPPATAGRSSRGARLALGLLGAALIATLLWWVRWDSTAQHAYPDTYWYAKQAATATGMADGSADRFAARVTCRYGMPAPKEGVGCEQSTRDWAAAMKPRYKRIFTTRPGFSLVAAPFVIFFAERGLVLATAALAVLAGVLAALAVRLLGGGLFSSLSATVLLFLLPTGFWLSRLLAEAGATAFALAALCATVLLLRSGSTTRTRLVAAGATLAFLLATTVTKPASGLLLSAALTALAVGMALLALARRRGADHGMLLLAGAAGLATAVWLALSAVFRIPGATETLQDKFTVHFTRPDVPDPWSRLLDLNREFWPDQFGSWLNGGAPLAASTFLAMVVIGVLALFRAAPARMALVWAVAGATGPVTLIAHPKVSESDRLVLFVWLPVVIGLALLLSRRAPVAGPDDDSTAPGPDDRAPALPSR